jgi:hypothetical protein
MFKGLAKFRLAWSRDGALGLREAVPGDDHLRGAAGFHITVLEPSYQKDDGRSGSGLGRFRATMESVGHTSGAFGSEFSPTRRPANGVAPAPRRDPIRSHAPSPFLQLRITCNKDQKLADRPLNPAFDHRNRQFRTDGFISRMAACRQICSDDESDRRNVRAGNAHPMSRNSRSNSRCNSRFLGYLFAGVGLSLLVFDRLAVAADLPLKAPVLKAVYSWTGFYFGGHVGYGNGSFGPNTNPLPEQGVFFPPSATGVIGGY